MNPREKRESVPAPRVGAVIVFRAGVTEKMARAMLSTLAPHAIKRLEVEEYDENDGEPVFYIP